METIVMTRQCPRDMCRANTWCIEQFELLKKIGEGYASSVFLARCKLSGRQVAIKLYHSNRLSELNLYQVLREIRIHSMLEHRNIIQLYAAFRDASGIYLVTEYAARGSVFQELERLGGTMSEAQAVALVLQPFVSALDYLHSLNIIHRDIKPENLLITQAGELKVGDFGLSIDFLEERPVTRVGTLDYMAPEVLACPDKRLPQQNKELTALHYSSAVDSWAVGVLAFELLVGRAPFDKRDKQRTMEEILKACPRFPSWMSEAARHFISWALTPNATQRPNVVQLLQHPWIEAYGSNSRSNKLRERSGRAESARSLARIADLNLGGQLAMMQQSSAAKAAALAREGSSMAELVERLKFVHKSQSMSDLALLRGHPEAPWNGATDLVQSTDQQQQQPQVLHVHDTPGGKAAAGAHGYVSGPGYISGCGSDGSSTCFYDASPVDQSSVDMEMCNYGYGAQGLLQLLPSQSSLQSSQGSGLMQLDSPGSTSSSYEETVTVSSSSNNSSSTAPSTSAASGGVRAPHSYNTGYGPTSLGYSLQPMMMQSGTTTAASYDVMQHLPASAGSSNGATHRGIPLPVATTITPPLAASPTATAGFASSPAPRCPTSLVGRVAASAILPGVVSRAGSASAVQRQQQLLQQQQQQQLLESLKMSQQGRCRAESCYYMFTPPELQYMQ